MITKPRIEIDLNKVEQLAGLGLTKAQIAYALGVSYDTLNNRRKESQDFQDAIKRGESKAVAFVSNKLMDQVKEGNTTAMIFWLKCRARWTETQRQIITDDTSENADEHSGLNAIYSRIKDANKSKDES